MRLFLFERVPCNDENKSSYSIYKNRAPSSFEGVHIDSACCTTSGAVKVVNPDGNIIGVVVTLRPKWVFSQAIGIL